jgi:hypothetical protein
MSAFDNKLNLNALLSGQQSTINVNSAVTAQLKYNKFGVCCSYRNLPWKHRIAYTAFILQAVMEAETL